MSDTNNEVTSVDFAINLDEAAIEAREKLKKDDNNITVKFVTRNLNIITRNFSITDQICEIKKTFMEMVKINGKSLELLYDKHIVDDLDGLNKMHLDVFHSLSLRVLNANVVGEMPVDKPKVHQLAVHVPVENNEYKEIVVEIHDKRIEKPKLGGYKNIKTGNEHYHGYSQTGPPKPKIDPSMLNNRSTQTYFTRNRRIQMDYARAVQTTNYNAWLPNTTDKIIVAKPYIPAKERDLEETVRIIIRYFRAWKMRKCLKDLHKEYFKRLQIEIERETLETLEDEERRRLFLVRQVFPLKSIDFKILYIMVNRWKMSGTKRINTYFSGDAKITQLTVLLSDETKLLGIIEKLQQKRRNDIEIAEMIEFFKTISRPLEWYSTYKNIHITMDTVERQKVRKLFAFFKRVTNKNQSAKERIRNLMDLKLFLTENMNCTENKNYTQNKDVTDLLERALQMLARGINEKYLQMLYKRIESNFFNYIKRNFNVISSSSRKTFYKDETKNQIFCRRCEKLKSITAFLTNIRAADNPICSACLWLDKVQTPCIDLTPYHFILTQIRNYERQHHATSSVAFIMQAANMSYLIDIIWHCHSALSECDDIYQLRMCRWLKNEDWSPWNCILLTAEEAKMHMLVERLEDVYEKEFFSHIFNKHVLARKRFSNINHYEKYFYEFSDDPLVQESFWAKKESQHCLKEMRQTIKQYEDEPYQEYYNMWYQIIGNFNSVTN